MFLSLNVHFLIYIYWRVNMESEENKVNPITKVIDIKYMPEEIKTHSAFTDEPVISTALELGEYIFKNKKTFPQDLMKLTEEKTTINDFNLKHLRLNKEGVKHLSVVLPFLKQITSADFSDMQLSSWDLEILSPSISKLTDLVELILVSNPIEEGAKYLCRSLHCLTKLEVLDLSDCQLNSNSISTICPGLASLNKLILLKLSLNPIGDNGCKDLSNTLTKMPMLTNLELFTCEITDYGAKFLEKAFRETMLESVILGNNKITPRYETKLRSKFPFVHFGIKHYNCLVF
jgi:Ran GTPase-activating protein (RanGAP) involved in mRNA processing and transport